MRTKTPIGTIYKKVIWPLYDTHDHALDALKEIMQGDTSIIDKLKIESNIKDELLKIIKERLSIQPFKIRADFKITCSQFEGIEAIKKALNEVKKSIEESKGDYILNCPPKILGDDEKNFSDQLKEVNNEDEEEENEEEKNEEGINPDLVKFEENAFDIKKQ